MKYYIVNAALGERGRTIETDKPIEELVAESKTGFIPLKKDGDLIGIELLKNSLIIKSEDRPEGIQGFSTILH